ncbi:hypothetical protein C2E21_5253 [Chlorella sorokiniana]|jgi:uncharacterized membrane protein YhaH (DUF805 family)|uniref:MARVEL domain-containing protein n=1 Tax=Chlorella sorokiniana TaxID=3076 RepID=A0A2P6TQL6_CHLSO|nr:hypothetical protein C2E21_5253 [Chlorella sorokiniana]|eukprot:PRW56331.1 hypothetical protein C2E21_5253 [Chlorella sorokiniana]
MAGTKAAAALLGFVALQIIFNITIPAVTSVQLNPGGGLCYLNLLKGSVCDFVYVTSGFGFLFSLVLLAPAISTLRGGQDRFLEAIFGSLSLFGAFWWMVLAITITIRGGQATDAGYEGTTARNAVIGLSWIEAVLFFFSFLAVVYDRIAFRRYRAKMARSRSLLDLEQRTEFKQHYAATQVLGSTPLA